MVVDDSLQNSFASPAELNGSSSWPYKSWDTASGRVSSAMSGQWLMYCII